MRTFIALAVSGVAFMDASNVELTTNPPSEEVVVSTTNQNDEIALTPGVVSDDDRVVDNQEETASVALVPSSSDAPEIETGVLNSTTTTTPAELGSLAIEDVEDGDSVSSRAEDDAVTNPVPGDLYASEEGNASSTVEEDDAADESASVDDGQRQADSDEEEEFVDGRPSLDAARVAGNGDREVGDDEEFLGEVDALTVVEAVDSDETTTVAPESEQTSDMVV